MCGRFSLNDKVHESIVDFVREGYKPEDWRPDRLWDPTWAPDPDMWRPNYNIAPTNDIAILFESAPPSSKGEDAPRLRFETAYWSLVPAYSPTLKMKYPTFNARSEGITEKTTWKGPVRQHRGIVLANGYYEWQTHAGTKAKTPYFIHDPTQPVIGFAGLYSWWQHRTKPDDDPDRWTLTATILTTDAIHTLQDIHDREPVILPRTLWPHWIDPGTTGDQHLVDEMVKAGLAEAEKLQPYEVAPLRGNGPQLVEPVAS